MPGYWLTFVLVVSLALLFYPSSSVRSEAEESVDDAADMSRSATKPGAACTGKGEEQSHGGTGFKDLISGKKTVHSSDCEAATVAYMGCYQYVKGQRKSITKVGFEGGIYEDSVATGCFPESGEQTLGDYSGFCRIPKGQICAKDIGPDVLDEGIEDQMIRWCIGGDPKSRMREKNVKNIISRFADADTMKEIFSLEGQDLCQHGTTCQPAAWGTGEDGKNLRQLTFTCQ